MGSAIIVSGLVKVEYSIQPLEPSQISVLNVIAIYKAVLSSRGEVGGATSSAPIKRWLTINEVQKFSQKDLLLRSQYLLQYLTTIEQGGGVAEEEGGAALQYIEREISWEEKILQQAKYGASGMLYPAGPLVCMYRDVLMQDLLHSGVYGEHGSGLIIDISLLFFINLRCFPRFYKYNAFNGGRVAEKFPVDVLLLIS